MLEVVHDNTDPTRACNAARVNTFVRPGSENIHGFKLTYKNFGHRCHNSRLVAIGPETLAHYNRIYGKNYGPEWAEAPKLLIEYLVMCGRYNENHPKFFR